MKKLIILFLCFLSFCCFAIQGNHVRVGKWDISPNKVKYMSLFFATEIAVFTLLNPQYEDLETRSSDFEYNQDEISTPKWAYELGNHGPTLLTLGQYSYYLLGSDQWGFEKAFVLTESLLAAQGTVFTLKYTMNSKRPDSSNYLSFPSGHSAHAFTIATFASIDILRSSNLDNKEIWASLPLLYAGYIGWTRIDAKKHRLEDVITGGLIGALSSYIMYDFHFDKSGRYKFDSSESRVFISPSINTAQSQFGLNIKVFF